MLITKEVETTWSNTNRKHYEDLGYKYVWRGKFIVPVAHLPINSHVKIETLCDYCLEEGLETKIPQSWQAYNAKIKDIIDKDCCKEHWYRKLAETNIINIGVENHQLLPEIQEKRKQTTFDRYGTTNPFDLDIFQDKAKQTNLEKYGFENYKQTKEAQEKSFGEGNPNWKGGITLLHMHLRTFILQWKKDSMEACNYKCVITGEKFKDIHHLYSFSLILKEILDYFDLQDINLRLIKLEDLSKDQISLIEGKCLELHNKYGLGVCLSEKVHTLFHHIYGVGDTTPEQFEEFKQNIKSSLIII